MVFFDRLHRIGHIRGISARIRGVSQRLVQGRLASRVIRHRKRALGVALLLVSLIVGIWAHDLAQAEALGGWLRMHPPSNRIWNHALESRGYRALSDLKQLQRASKTLPALVDEEGSVWTSSDTTWVAVFQKQDDGLSSVLYCLECQKPPAGWEPSGRGWEAFDPVLARADLAAKRLRPVAKPRQAPSDPRELRY